MPSAETYVIVGASLAGAKAAETLREEGFDGRVVLVGEEPVRPYERPPLSKDYLRGEQGFDDAAVHPAEFYGERDIEWRASTRVTGIDPAGKAVTLSDGEQVGYSRLLLATGAVPRRLPVAGADLAGVHYLRTVSDSDALKQAFGARPQVVVIGAGWIGAEVAASARQLGADVAMVELASLPLERVLGPELGTVYRDLHAEHGVDLHFRVAVEALVGSGGRVEEVRLTDGTTLPAQVVVVGIGVRPRTELAEAAGLRVDDGVVVDEYLRTSAPDVWAAGDVANAFYPRYGTHIRLEHWSAALNQGPAAARNLLGRATAYDEIPYFFSDQYDLGMEYRGWVPSYDRVVFRGDPAGREFVAFWLGDGRVRAALNANVWDQGDAIETILAAGRPLDPDRLADPGTDLGSLAASPST